MMEHQKVLKRVLLISAALAFANGAALAEGNPAGFVIGVELKGEDAATKLIITRGGDKLPAKLMMPLFAGDVIQLKDADSKLSLELEGSAEKEISATDGAVTISGEVKTGDDTWSVISAVVGVIGGDEEEGAVPDNMVSRGDEADLKIPMAAHGANYILAAPSLWLAWSGGKAPYTVLVEAKGLPSTTLTAAAQDVAITPPSGAERFTVTLTDADGRTASASFRVKDAVPQPADAGLPEGTAAQLVRAAWLTGQNYGVWKVAAAQILHSTDDPQAKALLEKIVQGWSYGG